MLPRVRSGFAVVWLVSAVISNCATAFYFKHSNVVSPVAAQITTGPSADELDLRVRKLAARTVTAYACASSCRSSIISEWTSCSPDDLGCTCQAANALVINVRGASCLESACGPLSASVVVAASDLCLKYEAGRLSTEFTTTVSITGTTHSVGSTVTTADNGSSTSSVSNSSPTTSSTVTSSGGNSGNSSNSSNNSSNTGSGGQSTLSTGAIAGIAVGSAVGAIILCAVLFMIYKFYGQNRKAAVVSSAGQAQHAPDTDNLNSTGKPELSGESKALTVPTPSPIPATSPDPILVPSPSPGPSVGSAAQSHQAQFQHPQFQQGQHPSVAEMQGWQPHGYPAGSQPPYVYHQAGELANTTVSQELSGTTSTGSIAYEMPGGTFPPR